MSETNIVTQTSTPVTMTGRIIEVGGSPPDCRVTIQLGVATVDLPLRTDQARDFAKRLYGPIRVTVELLP